MDVRLRAFDMIGWLLASESLEMSLFDILVKWCHRKVDDKLVRSILSFAALNTLSHTNQQPTSRADIVLGKKTAIVHVNDSLNGIGFCGCPKVSIVEIS